MSTPETERDVYALLAQCGDEFLSPADAAVITTRFAHALTADLIVRVPIDVAVDCRAFAEGAVIAARRANWAWSVPALTVVAELAAHHGLEAFSEAAQQLYLREWRSSNSITLWAESAATPREVVQRYHSCNGRGAVAGRGRSFDA